MTMSLCIRQESKRNDDSVNMEELDWSAERQVLIPAEHFWCDFKCRPWVKNSPPNTNDLYIWVRSFHTLQKCCNRGRNRIFKNMNYVSIVVATVWKCLFLFWRRGCPSTLVHIMTIIGVWWWVFDSRSSFKVTPKVFSWDEKGIIRRGVPILLAI